MMCGQFIGMLTYQQSNMCQEIFVAPGNQVSVDKEHSKQASVDNYKRWYIIVFNAAENLTTFRPFHEHGTTKLSLKEVATDLFYWKAST